MNGEMKTLKDVEYILSHDIESLQELNFQQLSLIKSEIELELEKSFQILRKNNITMESRLITDDGFPRSDINVIEIRNSRVKIIKLRNDLTKVINQLSEKIHDQFSNSKGIENDSESLSSIPFAKITEVVAESPAAQAGLNVGDKIIIFGIVNVTNHKNLQSVGLMVKNNTNKPLEIKIIRGSQKMHLQITPTSNWPGQGLLGCRIVQV